MRQTCETVALVYTGDPVDNTWHVSALTAGIFTIHKGECAVRVGCWRIMNINEAP